MKNRTLQVLCVFTFAAALWAQGERGTFNGIVTDQSGSVVPNAGVTATNVETNVETKTVTTDAGVYRLPYMPSGTYRISVGAPGFQTSVADNVILHVAQTLTVDFKLQVGAVSEQVTVSSETPLLETSTAEIGRYVSKKEYDTWPILVGDGQRQIQQFIFSALPGTVGGTFQGSINGGQYYSHEILIEGVPLGRFDLQGGSNNEFSPSADAVSEFKLQTGAMGAQYNGGQTSVANFAIKSGTNELHGTAFSYMQNDALNANSFSNNASGRPRPPFKLFNWGYAGGGPVYIPKVYDGRNKSFWFTDLEVTRTRDFTSTSFGTLPTPAFKQGDFSRLFDPRFTGRAQSGSVIGADALGRSIRYGQIYDPLSTQRLSGGEIVRDPFPGNIIPQSRWDPVARNILQKAPITDPINDQMLLNFPTLSSCCPVFDEHIIGIKGDQIINEKHRLSAYFNYTFRQRNNSPGGRWGPPPGTPTDVYQLQYTPGRLVRIAEDWTITPTVLNHAAIGYNRFGNLNQSVYVDQGWPEKIGLQNVAPTTFPTLTFNGPAYQGGGIGAGGRLGSGNAGGSYNGSTIVQDDVTIIHGAHNFKAGFEMRKYYYNSQGKSGSGAFAFSPVQTELPGYADSTGHAFASFLLGAVQDTSRGIVEANFGHRVSEPAFYFMDDWKVTRKLTLNLGIRWEIIGPLYEVAGRMSNLDPFLANPGAGGLGGALVFADQLHRNTFQNRYWKQIDPRFGFAYAMTKKFVIRGGYALTNTPPISNGFGFPGTLGYNGSISLNTSNTPLAFPVDPVEFLHDPYPSFNGTLPNHDPTLANGLGTTYIRPDGTRVPYVQNFNLGVEYQLPAQTVLEVSYIGNKGTRLIAKGLDALNQAPVSALALGDALLDPLSAHPGLVPLPYPGFKGTVAQALRPFPQFQGINEGEWPNFGTSRYDSLQAQVTRHFTKGLAILASYTWSKAITTGAYSAIDSDGAQDVYNRGLERSVTPYNIPQYFKVSWIYELPIGPGKALNVPGVAGKLVGGWTLTGIHNYRSGDPLSIGTSGLRSDTINNGTFRPDVVAGVPMVIYGGGPVAFGTGTPYLNPAAFAQVPKTANNVPLRLGTAPAFLPNVRGPAFFSEDFGIMKQFRFTETKSLEFRGDFANAFNRAGLGDPNTNVTSPLFGKITGASHGPRSIQLEARVYF